MRRHLIDSRSYVYCSCNPIFPPPYDPPYSIYHTLDATCYHEFLQTRRLSATFPHLEDLVAVFDDREGKEAGDDDDGDDGEGPSSGSGGSKRSSGGGNSGGASASGSTGGKAQDKKTSKIQRSSADSDKNNTSTSLYQAHLPEAEVAKGVLAGKLFQGTLRCSRTAWDACYVVVEGRALGGGSGADVDERISV